MLGENLSIYLCSIFLFFLLKLLFCSIFFHILTKFTDILINFAFNAAFAPRKVLIRLFTL